MIVYRFASRPGSARSSRAKTSPLSIECRINARTRTHQPLPGDSCAQHARRPASASRPRAPDCTIPILRSDVAKIIVHGHCQEAIARMRRRNDGHRGHQDKYPDAPADPKRSISPPANPAPPHGRFSPGDAGAFLRLPARRRRFSAFTYSDADVRAGRVDRHLARRVSTGLMFSDPRERARAVAARDVGCDGARAGANVVDSGGYCTAGWRGRRIGLSDLRPDAVRAREARHRCRAADSHPDQSRSEAAGRLRGDGPVFATATKATGHDPVGLRGQRAAHDRPSGGAIGGNTLGRADGDDAGAQSVAVISDLLRPETRRPCRRLRALE